MKLSRQFPLNALRVFEAVARLGSFTRGGEELGMTQTAVSYQIKLLEDHLGNAVFIRRPRALQLTETGLRLLPKVTEAFVLLSEGMTAANRVSSETLEIRSPPTFASHWLSRNLASFQAGHPNITVRLVRHMNGVDEDAKPTDISINIASKPADGLICHPLLRLDYTPMLHPALADRIGGLREPADLVKLPWISEAKHAWNRWFELTGIDPRAIRHVNLNTFGAMDLQGSAAMAGHGVAMLSPFFFREEVGSGRLVQPFDLCIGDGKTYWLCYPQARRNAAKILAFTSWIKAALGSDLAEWPDAPRAPAA